MGALGDDDRMRVYGDGKLSAVGALDTVGWPHDLPNSSRLSGAPINTVPGFSRNLRHAVLSGGRLTYLFRQCRPHQTP